MTLDVALKTPLMGQYGTWNGYGGKPMDLVPDGTLRQAYGFFRMKNKENPSDRLKTQMEAIELTLEHHAATNPQVSLAL